MSKLMEFHQGVKVGGHPLHVLLTHFPLAFLSVVFPLELAALLGWATGWTLAFWAQVAGLAASLPAAATGLLDLAALRDRPAADALANRHMYVMLGAVSAAGGGLFLKGGPAPVHGWEAFVILGLSLCSLGLLAWGGWLGGELVFRHGVAQKQG